MEEKRQRRIMDVTFASGGAKGADYEWTKCALKYGFPVVIYSFEGHASTLPPFSKDDKVDIRKLTKEELEEPYVKKDLLNAAKVLKKGCPSPSNTYVYPLLARNTYIAQSDLMIAVGYFKEGVPGLGVDGGTGWTCEVFYEASKNTRRGVKLTFYNMADDLWYECTHEGKWERLKTPLPFIPIHGSYTMGVIGSRDMTEKGIQAIADTVRSVYDKVMEDDKKREE